MARRGWALAGAVAIGACGHAPAARPEIPILDARGARAAVDTPSPASEAARPPPGGPRTAREILGEAAAVVPGTPRVLVVANTAAMRAHPSLSRIGPLIRATPQWSDYLASISLDPIQDVDWALVAGRSLRYGATGENVQLVRYAIPDGAADAMVDTLGRSYARGGPFDLKVAGAHGTLGFADDAERVFIRAQPQLLAIASPASAHDVALVLSRAAAPRAVLGAELFRGVFQRPSDDAGWVPEAITAARVWLTATDGGGAEFHALGDCADAEAAQAAAPEMAARIRASNTAVVRLFTQGLLNGAKVSSEGSEVHLEVPASPDQVEALLRVWAVGVGHAQQP